VVPVCDQGGTVESSSGSQSDVRRDRVPDGADRASNGERDEVGRGYRVKETPNRFKPGDARAREDRCHNEQPSPLLGHGGPHHEGDSQRYGSEGVSSVVDDIRQQGDAASDGEHSRLSDRGCAQNAKRPSNGAKAGARSLCGRIHETVAMTRGADVVVVAVVVVCRVLVVVVPKVVAVGRMRERDGSSEQGRDVPVPCSVWMLMPTATMAVQRGARHAYKARSGTGDIPRAESESGVL
jgi:hypothetical protein